MALYDKKAQRRGKHAAIEFQRQRLAGGRIGDHEGLLLRAEFAAQLAELGREVRVGGRAVGRRIAAGHDEIERALAIERAYRGRSPAPGRSRRPARRHGSRPGGAACRAPRRGCHRKSRRDRSRSIRARRAPDPGPRPRRSWCRSARDRRILRGRLGWRAAAPGSTPRCRPSPPDSCRPGARTFRCRAGPRARCRDCDWRGRRRPRSWRKDPRPPGPGPPRAETRGRRRLAD